MNLRAFFAAALAYVCLLMGGCATGPGTPAPDTRLYELRVYTFNPGKKDDLLNRFRFHTLRLFAKHGIDSVGYWLPVDPADNRLHFLLRYPSREAREASWRDFLADPDWQAAYKDSESNGPLLAHAPENFYMEATDFSPAVLTGDITHGGVFELRTYTTPSNLLPNLDARFRDHTIALFAKHGMGNYAYFHRLADQPGGGVTLQYFVTHKSKEAAAASFAEFGKDPDWVAAKKASEEKAGGSLTVQGGVKSVFLSPVDFSPTK